MRFLPLIKYPGNKRKINHIIRDCNYEYYIEPFCGGCSLLPYRKCEEGYFSDINPDIISIWNVLKTNTIDNIISHYTNNRNNFIRGKEKYYYEIRERFNKYRDPLDLLFLTRTCISGMVRFNSGGDFNSPVHHNRNGIEPDKLKHQLQMWKPFLKKALFFNNDYRESLEYIKKNTLFFLDPPYENTNNGFYSKQYPFEKSHFFRISRIFKF